MDDVTITINGVKYVGVESNVDGFAECSKCVFFMQCMDMNTHCGFLGLENMDRSGWICKSYDEECLLLGSKHYETLETRISLNDCDAYDDKGNKIESEYITLKNKEYDNDIRRS